MKKKYFKPPRYKVGDVILKRKGDFLRQFVIVDAYIMADDVDSDYFHENNWQYKLSDGKFIEEKNIFFKVYG